MTNPDSTARLSFAPLTSTVRKARTPGLMSVQSILGACAYACFALPYLRRVHGLERLSHQERYLFVSNHVSLLDTILLGGLFWRRGCYPILVLGDKNVWHASAIRRVLSNKIGFLLERGKLNVDRIHELETFGQSIADFHLVVYPEGTRGDGVTVGPCQPGICYIAQKARAPIVPVFIANMQRVSTKHGRFHPLGGLRQIEVYVGEPIAPTVYLSLSRDEFTEFVRTKIAALPPTR